MNFTTKEYILIGAFLLIIFIAYNQGVFTKDKAYKLSPGQVTDGSQVTISPEQAKQYAVNFRKAMLDNTLSDTVFIEACRQLLGLSQADLIMVHNEYGKIYTNQEYNTLRSALSQEWAIFPTSAQYKEALLKKFNQAGI